MKFVIWTYDTFENLKKKDLPFNGTIFQKNKSLIHYERAEKYILQWYEYNSHVNKIHSQTQGLLANTLSLYCPESYSGKCCHQVGERETRYYIPSKGRSEVEEMSTILLFSVSISGGLFVLLTTSRQPAKQTNSDKIKM